MRRNTPKQNQKTGQASHACPANLSSDISDPQKGMFFPGQNFKTAWLLWRKKESNQTTQTILSVCLRGSVNIYCSEVSSGMIFVRPLSFSKDNRKTNMDEGTPTKLHACVESDVRLGNSAGWSSSLPPQSQDATATGALVVCIPRHPASNHE